MKQELYLGDCLEVMPTLAVGSVDLVLCDLPYGTTECVWDCSIDLKSLWRAYDQICKKRVILTGVQPFSSTLVASNIKSFKHEWIWEKTRGSNPAQVKHAPLKKHESVLVFGKGPYNPQMTKGPMAVKSGRGAGTKSESKKHGVHVFSGEKVINDSYYPGSVIKISSPRQGGGFHPTQKPTALLEYIIRTYTNEGDTVLDNTMGSGSTGVACMSTGRNFIGIERDPAYFEIAKNRIEEAAR